MTDYGYCHARVRGMKSSLLPLDLLEQLIACRETSEITAILNETIYSPDIHHGLVRYAGAGGVEEGLRLNLAGTFQTILGLVDGEARRVIGLLLERWDIQNIKTVLRGKHIGAGSEEILSSLVPAGALPEGILVGLAKEPDIKATIDLMATWGIGYSKPLTRNFSSYVTSNSLAELEKALDKYYYANSLAQLNNNSFDASLVRELLCRQIDFSNVMTLLRLAREGTNEHAGRFFISGGKEVSRELFDRLAAFDQIEDIAAGLAETSYYGQLAQGLDLYRTLHSFAAVERALEEQAVRKTVGLFRAEPLSLAVIVAYIWAKVNEVINVRIILRAKEVGMPSAAIREALVLVN